jgi:hypothetical protein
MNADDRPEGRPPVSSLVTVTDDENVEANWPKPLARALPDFPVDALPRSVAAWVAATADHTQTPADLAAVAALGVLSGAALGRAVVDCGAWEEELGLYLLPALPSGERKSTVLRAAIGPLRALERERRDAAAAQGICQANCARIPPAEARSTSERRRPRQARRRRAGACNCGRRP